MSIGQDLVLSEERRRNAARDEVWNQAISAACDLISRQANAAGREIVRSALELSYEAVRALKR